MRTLLIDGSLRQQETTRRIVEQTARIDGPEEAT